MNYDYQSYFMERLENALELSGIMAVRGGPGFGRSGRGLLRSLVQ